ncbi:TPA: hypothetical protein QEF71_002268 [Stenotrophomonas maltophilia]|nr:hypothetical protein [Stenotrophomonas maltophilia]
MKNIEKRARELFEAARGLYNATIGDPSVTIRCESAASRDAVAAAGERLRLTLLDQRPALIPADGLQVVTSSAPGAHEVHPEAVDVGLDLAEPRERLMAADALEHRAGVLPEGDGAATDDHVEDERKLVNRALVLQILSSHTTEMEGYSYFSSNPGIPEDHYEEIADEIVAALTPPEGYVMVPVELPVEMEIAFMEAWVSKRRCIDDPEMQDAWEAALAVRPEVKP